MSRLRDAETTARIKLALIANPYIGGLDIGVDTVNGIVFLTGFAQDSQQKELAAEIAKSHGGLDIKNDIEVLSIAA
jgi:hyperosmotically inducible protein